MSERRFPSPFSIETPPGCEGWERMCPYHYLFSEENRDYDENTFWFQDAKDAPEPMNPWEIYWSIVWPVSFSEQNSRVFCIPTANGLTHRILNGYLYLAANAVTDPQEIEERAALCQKRAGYYYEHWNDLFDNWVKKMTALIKNVEAMEFRDLPLYEDEVEVMSGKGIWSPYKLMETWDRFKRSWWEMYEYHFEFLNLTYAAYVTFYEFCQKAFPQMPAGIVPRMIAGSSELSMMRPQEELAKLAKLAVGLGIRNVFKEKTSTEDIIQELQTTREGRRWLEVLEIAKDPWFYTSTGTGYYAKEKCWLDDLSIPFSYIISYLDKLDRGESIERDTDAVSRARDQLVNEYSDMLRTEEDRKAFHELHQLLMKVYPYAETHIFYCEHWFQSIHRNRARALGQVLTNAGFLTEADDFFYFHPHEIEWMLEDLVNGWAAGPGIPTRGGRGYFLEELQQRKKIIENLRKWTPPPALGPAPEAITEPMVIHLWGMTDDSINAWLNQGTGVTKEAAEELSELSGFPASPGVVEGVARVLRDFDQLGEVQQDDILVAPITSPSWSPIFHKLKAVVTDMGGISSHAAIVAREYGLICVTGVGYGTTVIKTGDTIRVDGTTGIVTILHRALDKTIPA